MYNILLYYETEIDMWEFRLELDTPIKKLLQFPDETFCQCLRFSVIECLFRLLIPKNNLNFVNLHKK